MGPNGSHRDFWTLFGAITLPCLLGGGVVCWSPFGLGFYAAGFGALCLLLVGWRLRNAASRNALLASLAITGAPAAAGLVLLYVVQPYLLGPRAGPIGLATAISAAALWLSSATISSGFELLARQKATKLATVAVVIVAATALALWLFQAFSSWAVIALILGIAGAAEEVNKSSGRARVYFSIVLVLVVATFFDPSRLADQYGFVIGVTAPVVAACILMAAWYGWVEWRLPSAAAAEKIQSQKVHGGARLATEQETLATARSGAGRVSSAHEQEF